METQEQIDERLRPKGPTRRQVKQAVKKQKRTHATNVTPKKKKCK